MILRTLNISKKKKIKWGATKNSYSHLEISLRHSTPDNLSRHSNRTISNRLIDHVTQITRQFN